MEQLAIYSGDVCMGDVGTPVLGGMHVGDIVIVWKLEHRGTEFERWEHVEHLSAVVLDPESRVPFVMGIKACGFDHPEWRIDVLKKYSDVVEGERWPAFGFRYARRSESK